MTRPIVSNINEVSLMCHIIYMCSVNLMLFLSYQIIILIIGIIHHRRLWLVESLNLASILKSYSLIVVLWRKQKDFVFHGVV